LIPSLQGPLNFAYKENHFSGAYYICIHLCDLFCGKLTEYYLLYRFEEQEAPGSRSFFTEIIASISDIKFGKDGRYILSRDYMTLKVLELYYSKTHASVNKAFLSILDGVTLNLLN